MVAMPMTEARKSFAEVVDRVRVKRQPIALERNGRRVAVIVSSEQWEELENLRDRLDLEEAERRMADEKDRVVDYEAARRKHHLCHHQA